MRVAAWKTICCVPVIVWTLTAAQFGQAGQRITPEASLYLDQAIGLFRNHHINRDKVDWIAARTRAFAAAEKAQTSRDTYPAIQLIIDELGEKHTSLMPPEHAKAQATGKQVGSARPPQLTLPEGEQLTARIGMVRLPAFSGSEAAGAQYVAAGREVIRSMQVRNACGFVLDLRSNTGGNMWPMLNAVTGLLDEGVLGSFVSVAGQTSYWVRRNGEISISPMRAEAQQVAPGGPPVAVLIGLKTASSGEFTAMAFAGRPHTRFFGSATAGYATANQPMPLSDGAVILMTGAWGVDRTGKTYRDDLRPDVQTPDGLATVQAAVEWLESQGCAASKA